MNRTLLALAVTAALAVPLTAQAAPTVYGMLNLSLDMVDVERDTDLITPGVQAIDQFQVNSNSSRLGVMGEEDLGNGYSAVYKAEWGVAGDVAGIGDLVGRDRYIGLKSGWGTVKLGAFDSPFKSSQGNVDQFNDMVFADMGSYVTGENRQDNVIGYESPKIADAITVKVSLQAGESNADDGFAEAISASVAYETDSLYLAAAMDKDASNGGYSAAAGTGRDALRLTGVLTMGDLQLGAMLQTSETSNEGLGGVSKDDETVMLVSAAYNMGKNTFKGQVALVNDDFGGGAESDSTFLAVGYDHNFTQMTKAFAQVSMLSTDNPGLVADTDDTIVTVGMQTKF